MSKELLKKDLLDKIFSNKSFWVEFLPYNILYPLKKYKKDAIRGFLNSYRKEFKKPPKGNYRQITIDDIFRYSTEYLKNRGITGVKYTSIDNGVLFAIHPGKVPFERDKKAAICLAALLILQN